MGLPAVALAIGAIGTTVSSVGALSSASATSQAAAYQAQVAKNNATIAGQNAESATQAGQAQATAQSLRARATLGAVTAAEGASNIDVNTGSALESRESAREIGTLDTETTAANAAMTAYGYRTQATGYLAQSQLDTATAQSAEEAGGIGAAGSLLSGASSLGSKWVAYQQSAAGTSGAPAGVASDAFAP